MINYNFWSDSLGLLYTIRYDIQYLYISSNFIRHMKCRNNFKRIIVKNYVISKTSYLQKTIPIANQMS